MIPGKKYRVIFMGTSINREMVARFLDETEDYFYFDLRPLAGTQTLSKRDVLSIYKTHEDEKLFLPRNHQGETRVL